MNKKRRNLLADVAGNLSSNLCSIAEVADAEQEAFDNMPENLKESERGDTAEEAIDTLNEVLDSLNEAIDKLETLL